MSTEFELEVSDEALAVVDGWLGIKHTDEIEASELPEQRPLRLGLGAKFLPHKLVAQRQSDALEKKLQRSLKRTAQNNEDDAEGTEALQQGNSDEDEDAAGRGTARGPDAKKRKLGAGVDALELLASKSSKKKKKKKSKEQAEATSADAEGTEASRSVPGRAESDQATSSHSTASTTVQIHAKARATQTAAVAHKGRDAPKVESNNDSSGDKAPGQLENADGEDADLFGWGSWGAPTSADTGPDGGFDADTIARIEAHFGGRKGKARAHQQPPAATEKPTAKQHHHHHHDAPALGAAKQQKEAKETPGKPQATKQEHGGLKKTKKRSKQKNIKKDNRPLDQRPAHLREGLANKTEA